VAIALSLALAWLAPANSLAYSARVRWQPSTTGSIAEYEVYKRTATEGYGASEPGTPTADSGGVLSLVVSNLDVRTDYFFRVKAVATSGTSPLSNEVRIGYADVAGVLDSDGDGLRDAQEDVNLNRLVDAGESDPTRADSDGDGVGDLADTCEGTAAGAAVSIVGCSCAQITCGDGNACNGTETCSAGVCRAGTPLVCNDGNACTTDSCNPSTGCTATPIAGCASCTSSSQCNDNNPCTTNSCSNGMCAYPAAANGTACSDGNVCNGAETCQSGTCAAGTPLVCNDGNGCTTDGCNPTSGCTTTPIAGCASCTSATQCNDNNSCTTNTCSNGMCAYPAVANGTACGDGNACNGGETCQSGTCAAGTPLTCNDGNSCTTDSCDPASGCTTTPIAGCASCTGASQCNDGNACTSNTCANGMCQFVPFADGSACSDGNACTTGDRCTSGRCAGTGAMTCPAAGPCAAGRCDATLGCVTDPVPDGTACDDGDVCTTNDACSAGVCAAGTSTASTSMTVQRFSVRSIGDTEQRVRGRTTLSGGAALELDSAGMTLEIDDATGAQLYGIDLPGSAFLPQARAGGARLSIRPDVDSKLRRLAVSIRGEDASVRFTIVGDKLIPSGSNSVTLKVRPPNGCGRRTGLVCRTRGSITSCAAPEDTVARDRGPGSVGTDLDMDDVDAPQEAAESAAR
jgi:hypothetical protein